jgi:hypothetical protein
MTTARAKFHADQAGLLALRKAAERPVQGRTATLRRKAVSPVILAMSEAKFQREVKESLEKQGYIVWTFPIMKRTTAGVPDLTFWNPNRPGVLHMWELKREKGRIRPEQIVAIAHLSTVPGVDARFVRPSEWPALRDALIDPQEDI